MIYLKALIYGLTQGLTEFLPVSSSGHLVLLHKYLPLPFANNLSFDVMLHLGTLLAVLLYFNKDILDLIKLFWAGLKNMPHSLTQLPFVIVFATLPAVVAGLLLNDYMVSNLESPLPVAVMLAVVSALFLYIERKPEKFVNPEINLKNGILIGLAQAIAVIPGVSRSGITIITGLALGIKREAAVRFSFLLSILIIAGASVKKVPILFETPLLSSEYMIIGIAFLAAFVSGLWAIDFMIKFMKVSTLKPFAYYRIALAAIVLILYFV